MRTELGLKVGVFHGELTTEERDDVIEKLRRGHITVMIATNVLARGVDIDLLECAINVDVPVGSGGRYDPDAYIHRVHRVGRFGRLGVAFNILDTTGGSAVDRANMAGISGYFGLKPHLINHEEDEEMLEEMVEAHITGRTE